ncbi:hypothetical protein CP532_6160 [Ophiocordyceps camponoti-leonardi (nom. inval.)]|nr:hypothetical protein CP532_6160 [Ophiocordyceps camponoti-leonardi (nom. inval.)]
MAATKPIHAFNPKFALLPASTALPPAPVHKIHIIGEDAKAKYMAHVLCDIYESVELLGWRRVSSKYSNISSGEERSRGKPTRPWPSPTGLKRNAVPDRRLATDDSSHIDLLVVTGPACDAAAALDSIKHRVDDKSTICLMSEGLGVLSDVKERIFEHVDSKPDFLLGYMSHRVVWHRNSDSVKRLKDGETKVTHPISDFEVKEIMRHRSPRPTRVDTWSSSHDLRSSVTAYDEWLQFKMPGMIFDCCVEPVCTVLELSYKNVMWNRAAQSLINKLMNEILNVIRHMYEIQGSPVMRSLVNHQRVSSWLRRSILARRDQPCQLAKRIEYGLPTDVEYRNDYFIRRARQMGIYPRTNATMSDIIKAKQIQALARINSQVRFEETTIPGHLEEQYRSLLQ